MSLAMKMQNKANFLLVSHVVRPTVSRPEDSDHATAGNSRKIDLELIEVEFAGVLAVASSAERLKKHGLTETEASIANKISRGTFSAMFFLASLIAIKSDVVRLKDI